MDHRLRPCGRKGRLRDLRSDRVQSWRSERAGIAGESCVAEEARRGTRPPEASGFRWRRESAEWRTGDATEIESHVRLEAARSGNHFRAKSPPGSALAAATFAYHRPDSL